MKKITALFLSCLLVFSCIGMVAFADAAPIDVKIDEVPVTFDAPPFIENDRTLVPIRALCVGLGIADENIGFADGVVTIRGTVNDAEIAIQLTIDSDIALVNGEEVVLDVAAKIVSDRTFVPLRFVSETFSCEVEFEAASEENGYRSLISIKTPAYTTLNVFLSQSVLDQDVGKLLEIAAAITGVQAIQGLVSEDEKAAENLELVLAAKIPTIVLDNGFVSPENLKKWAADGLIAKLDDAMAKYSPAVLEEIKSNKELAAKVTAEDGSIIAFPVTREGKTEFLICSASVDLEKAVGMIHGYNEVIKSLVG